VGAALGLWSSVIAFEWSWFYGLISFLFSSFVAIILYLYLALRIAKPEGVNMVFGIGNPFEKKEQNPIQQIEQVERRLSIQEEASIMSKEELKARAKTASDYKARIARAEKTIREAEAYRQKLNEANNMLALKLQAEQMEAKANTIISEIQAETIPPSPSGYQMPPTEPTPPTPSYQDMGIGRTDTPHTSTNRGSIPVGERCPICQNVKPAGKVCPECGYKE